MSFRSKHPIAPFGRPPSLMTLDSFFEQKIGRTFAPNGPTLEFGITGHRINVVDLQIIYLMLNCQISKSDATKWEYYATCHTDRYADVCKQCITFPLQSKHSIALFGRPPSLITFDTSCKRKIGRTQDGNGPTLEFGITGQRTNFVELQKFYFDVNCQITKSDGTNLEDHATDARQRDMPIFANNALHSLVSVEASHSSFWETFITDNI